MTLKTQLNLQAKTFFTKACTSNPAVTDNNNNVTANKLTFSNEEKFAAFSLYSV